MKACFSIQTETPLFPELNKREIPSGVKELSTSPNLAKRIAALRLIRDVITPTLTGKTKGLECADAIPAFFKTSYSHNYRKAFGLLAARGGCSNWKSEIPELPNEEEIELEAEKLIAELVEGLENLIARLK